jgi:hypothetical protein
VLRRPPTEIPEKNRSVEKTQKSVTKETAIFDTIWRIKLNISARFLPNLKMQRDREIVKEACSGNYPSDGHVHV